MEDTTGLGLLCLGAFVLGLIGLGVYLLTKPQKESPPLKNVAPSNPDTLPSNLIMEAIGTNGVLKLFSNKIRITRKGFLTVTYQGMKGEKEILLRQISSIQLKLPGTFTNGYIQFAFLGGTENKGGLFDAVQDENTVVFNSTQTEAFVHIKQAIEERIEALLQPQALVAASSSADEIEKLASLRDRKIISEEEFQTKKKQLLG